MAMCRISVQRFPRHLASADCHGKQIRRSFALSFNQLRETYHPSRPLSIWHQVSDFDDWVGLVPPGVGPLLPDARGETDAMAAKGTGNAARRTDETLEDLRAFRCRLSPCPPENQADANRCAGADWDPSALHLSETENGVQNLTLGTMVTLAGALKTRDT